MYHIIKLTDIIQVCYQVSHSNKNSRLFTPYPLRQYGTVSIVCLHCIRSQEWKTDVQF